MSSAEYSCKLFKPIFAYRQTVWTLIRLLLEEQSDLGPNRLQKWLFKSQADDRADNNCCGSLRVKSFLKSPYWKKGNYIQQPIDIRVWRKSQTSLLHAYWLKYFSHAEGVRKAIENTWKFMLFIVGNAALTTKLSTTQKIIHVCAYRVCMIICWTSSIVQN